MVNPQVGFQPRTTPAERRADLDQRRRATSDLDTALTSLHSDPGTFTGPIVVDRDATDPNYVSNKTGATNVDGVVHLSIRSNGTEIGRITRATSTTAGYLTTSDADLKQNMRPVDDELTLLWMRSTEPLLFEYKDRPDVRHVGYSAQQIAELWPNAILNGIITPGYGNIEDRTFDEDGNETTPYGVWQAWMMDHAKMTPVLHAGLRTLDRIIEARGVTLAEHEARIDSLEDTVAALEAQIAALIDTVTAQNDAVDDLRVDIYYTRQMAANWQYSNTVTPPPGAGQVRTNTALTEMYIHSNDDNGYNRTLTLDSVMAFTAVDHHSVRFRVRGATGSVFELRSNGRATKTANYYTVPITVLSGTPTDKGFRVEITMLSKIWAEDPPPLPTPLPT